MPPTYTFTLLLINARLQVVVPYFQEKAKDLGLALGTGVGEVRAVWLIDVYKVHIAKDVREYYKKYPWYTFPEWLCRVCRCMLIAYAPRAQALTVMLLPDSH